MPKELRIVVVVGHSAAEDTHDDYGDIQNDYSVRDKQAAIEALQFDRVIDYARLAMKAPNADDLSVALSSHSRNRQGNR